MLHGHDYEDGEKTRLIKVSHEVHCVDAGPLQVEHKLEQPNFRFKLISPRHYAEDPSS